MADKIKIRVFGKNYHVKATGSSVSPEETAKLVDSKMQGLSKAPGAASSTDLAVLVALNLGQELLELKSREEDWGKEMESRLDRLIQSLEKEVQPLNP